jgi:hypothetical protein
MKPLLALTVLFQILLQYESYMVVVKLVSFFVVHVHINKTPLHETNINFIEEVLSTLCIYM